MVYPHRLVADDSCYSCPYLSICPSKICDGDYCPVFQFHKEGISSFSIPFYGDHVSLFALLMAASNLLYTKMNMESMGSTNSMPGMKTMMYIMPVMFLGFLNSYSSGLNYYYFLSTMFTFGQMYLIRQFVNEDKIHAKIQENKKKPVVKSKFQQRIEDMAKQRGYGSTPAKKK